MIEGVPRRLSKPRPAQGARLLALRHAAGLSQTELAHELGVPQSNIALWERSEKPPRSDILPKMALVLGVKITDLLENDEKKTVRPAGRLQEIVTDLRKLPRRNQERILDVVSALLEQSKTRDIKRKPTK